MGGSGAIVFCRRKGYQLIASKKYNGNGKLGYTLIRKHPLTHEENITRKSTWYEYLKINGQIASFDILELDLALYNRKFKTGTIIKLYSYDLPTGISDISKDLGRNKGQTLNMEYA